MYRIIGADGREYGPVNAERMREWIAEGRANAQTKARRDDDPAWKPLVEYLEFASQLARTTAPLYAPTAISLPPVRRTNPLATTALVMGILSITCGMCCCYGAPFNILGIIFGLVAVAQIRGDSMMQQGQGLAIAGVALSVLSILLSMCLFLFGMAMNAPEIWRKMERM